MSTPLRFRFSTGHALWFAALAPLCVVAFLQTRYWWVGIIGAAFAAIIAFGTVSGQHSAGWMATAWTWLRRRRQPPQVPSEPVVGATVKPGDHVAVRWQGDELVAVIDLIPRPFTPTVVVDGQTHTDDVLDTRLLEHLVSVYCPDLVADVVSAGNRHGAGATAELLSLYRQLTGADPAPANRRTWITLRARPERALGSAQLRGEGIPGLGRYLVSSATRIADRLAGHGVDAVCARGFDDYDRATDVGLVRERWSTMLCHKGFTTAYTADGGPDLWWSVAAEHTVTRVCVSPGQPPRSTVLLTTVANPTTPKGFSRLFGGQRTALSGQNFIADRHWQLPIGSAGVLIGETANRCPVYMPFDDVDACITLGDAQAFAQFTSRAAAAGGSVTVGPRFAEFAKLIGARVGPVPKVTWPTATTYLGRHPGIDRVVLRSNLISTPRHSGLPIRRVTPPEESRYQAALPR